jgi:hypothetical protein
MHRSFTYVLIIVLLATVIEGPSHATEPVTITILTLDSRPPNTLLVQQIAAIAGIDLVFTENPSGADIVSVNAAVAGSLVGSRTADPWSLSPPEVRPDALLHFAVPRAQPTVLEGNVQEEYSRVIREFENPDMQREVLAVVQGNSESPDDQYLAAYANRLKGWLDFLARCDFDPDRLLVTLDDNRPGPLSDGLKLMLAKYSRHVQDGTDEGMMLLLARALRERQVSSPNTCGIVFTDPGDLTSVMPFEGGMVAENVLRMCEWLELRMSPKIDLYEPWRPVIWIHGAGTPQGERAVPVTETVARLGNRTIIVADIAKTNGGDPELIETWEVSGTPQGLIGYLAWNTSSNTLGSAFALWVAIDFAYEHGSDPEGVRAAAETFLWARLLDDYFYQTVERNVISTEYRDSGGDVYHVAESDVEGQSLEIARRLTELWRESGVPLALPLRYVEPLDNTSFIVELPWNRFFEIALYVTDNRGILPTIRPVDSASP